MHEKARVPIPAITYPRVPPTCTASQVAGERAQGGKGCRRSAISPPPPCFLTIFPTSGPPRAPPPLRQSVRDGCWGRSDVCNADKMSAILNGSGDAAVGGGEGERAEQGGKRKGK